MTHLTLTLSGLLLAGIAALLTSCADDHPKSSKTPLPAVRVTIDTVRRSSMLPDLSVVGRVVAGKTARIESQVQATISSIPVLLGEQVVRGQELLRLDQSALLSEQASARSDADVTARQLMRYDSLFAARVVSQREYDLVRADAERAAAALALATTRLAYTSIRSPFDGRIKSINVEAGDLALPGRQLMEIDATAGREFHVPLSEQFAASLRVGDSVHFLLDADSIRRRGIVAERAASPDPATMTRLLVVSMAETPDAQIGQIGRLLLARTSDASVFIPAAGLIRRGQLELVFVVDSLSTARLRLIRTGRVMGDQIEVLSGLRAGEPFVDSPAPQLRDGQQVTAQ